MRLVKRAFLEEPHDHVVVVWRVDSVIPERKATSLRSLVCTTVWDALLVLFDSELEGETFALVHAALGLPDAPPSGGGGGVLGQILAAADGATGTLIGNLPGPRSLFNVCAISFFAHVMPRVWLRDGVVRMYLGRLADRLLQDNAIPSETWGRADRLWSSNTFEEEVAARGLDAVRAEQRAIAVKIAATLQSSLRWQATLTAVDAVGFFLALRYFDGKIDSSFALATSGSATLAGVTGTLLKMNLFAEGGAWFARLAVTGQLFGQATAVLTAITGEIQFLRGWAEWHDPSKSRGERTDGMLKAIAGGAGFGAGTAYFVAGSPEFILGAEVGAMPGAQLIGGVLMVTGIVISLYVAIKEARKSDVQRWTIAIVDSLGKGENFLGIAKNHPELRQDHRRLLDTAKDSDAFGRLPYNDLVRTALESFGYGSDAIVGLMEGAPSLGGGGLGPLDE